MNRDEIIARYRKVDSSNVADVLDTLGHFDQGLTSELAPFPTDGGKIAGWAYTIRGQMTPYEGSGDVEKMKACAGLTSGDIAVWSGDGDGICYFGELIAISMKERGCRGALVDGGVRDVKWLKESQFPVYARYRSPTQSIGRWKVNAWQVPVYMRGATSKSVQIRPGDFILGDEDGVIVIPFDLVTKALVAAEALTEKEMQIRAHLRKGMTLAEALEKFGHI